MENEATKVKDSQIPNEDRQRKIKIPPLKKLLFLFIGALMLSFSYAPYRAGFVAWFALIPLLVVLEDVSEIGSFLWGYLFGFLMSLISLWWLVFPTLPGMIGAMFYLSFFWGLFSVLYYIMYRFSNRWALWTVPVIYIFIEYVRAQGRMGFPWQDLAYTQTFDIYIIQIADITGSLGISLFVILLNILLYRIFLGFLKKEFKTTIILSSIILIMFVVVYGYGFYALSKSYTLDEKIRVAICQGNINPYKKWREEMRRKNIEIYSELVDSVGMSPYKADIIILPETTTGGFWRRRRTRFYMLENRAHDYNIPILTGTNDFEPSDRSIYYNSAYLINPSGQDQTYNKIQLVPFSEQVPYQENSKFLRDLKLGGSHFTRGNKYTIFEIDNYKFAVTICYEALFANINREFRKRGAQVIFNITNDGWFQNSPGSYQHYRFNILRAVENRVYLCRAGNTGISAIIDPYGNEIEKSPLFVKTIVKGFFYPAKNNIPFYTKHGDYLGWISIFIVPVMIFLAIIKTNL